MFESKYKVVLAEDDNQTRTHLQKIISQFKCVDSVAAAANGRELVTMVKELNPDLVIADIEMPEMDGLKAINVILDEGLNPFIIFLTGHSEFALEAFELSAIDYITKPVRVQRLQKAFEKLESFKKKQEKRLTQIKSILNSPEKIFIRTGTDLIFIDTESIVMVEYQTNNSVIFCRDCEHATFETLYSLEEKLAFPEFYRSHKGYIINLKYVSQIKKLGNRNFEVSFQHISAKALISRSKAQDIFRLLGITE